MYKPSLDVPPCPLHLTCLTHYCSEDVGASRQDAYCASLLSSWDREFKSYVKLKSMPNSSHSTLYIMAPHAYPLELCKIQRVHFQARVIKSDLDQLKLIE